MQIGVRTLVPGNNTPHRFTKEYADKHQQELEKAGKGFLSGGKTILLAILRVSGGPWEGELEMYVIIPLPTRYSLFLV